MSNICNLILCFRFEQALHHIEPGLALPYWDSVLDSYLPDPRDSVLFTPTYMGSARGSVNGPFEGFPVLSNCHLFGSTLERNANGNANWLYTEDDIDHVLSKSSFSALANDPRVEADHGGVHQFFTGHMSDLNCATADPLFYLHHSFVDCIFQDFLDAANPPVTPSFYPSPALGDSHHQASSLMTPCLGIRNSDGLDASRYLHYRYEEKPSSISCTSDSDCGNPDALWCDTRMSPAKCRARVKRIGNCAGLPDAACRPCTTAGKTQKCVKKVCRCVWM